MRHEINFNDYIALEDLSPQERDCALARIAAIATEIEEESRTLGLEMNKRALIEEVSGRVPCSLGSANMALEYRTTYPGG